MWQYGKNGRMLEEGMMAANDNDDDFDTDSLSV
jgi:hypothetical protein